MLLQQISCIIVAREKFWHVFQRTITDNLYDETRRVFKTDEHGICATRHVNPLMGTLKPQSMQRTIIQQYSDWYTSR